MDRVGAASEMVVQAKRVVILTGAGISTESGIPDFRSPGGIWDKYDPGEFTFDKFLSSESSREKLWEFYQLLWETIDRARPNRSHLAIAELVNLGKVDCVITQNVDNLLQAAGVPEERIIELHGTLRWVDCLVCGKRFSRAEVARRLLHGERAPRCECGGIMKPATITFGQPMPEREVREAQRRAAECDLFIVIGSSLVAHPAAQIPLIAKDRGAKLVIINLSSTPHDTYSDIVINGRIGKTLSSIVERVKAKLKDRA